MPEREHGHLGTCPECGALLVEGLSCWEQLGFILAWEYQDAELRAVHFVTVASYNLQHPAQFTDEAMAGLRQAFLDHLDRGISVGEIRRRASAATEGKQRVLRVEEARRLVLRKWEMTIADVYAAGRVEGAAERVRRWASVIRREL